MPATRKPLAAGDGEARLPVPRSRDPCELREDCRHRCPHSVAPPERREGARAFLDQGGIRIGRGVGLSRSSPVTHKEGMGSDRLGRRPGLRDEPAQFRRTASRYRK